MVIKICNERKVSKVRAIVHAPGRRFVLDRLSGLSCEGMLSQKMKRLEGDDIADESRRIGCHPIQLGWHTPSKRVITARAAILAIIYPPTFVSPSARGSPGR